MTERPKARYRLIDKHGRSWGQNGRTFQSAGAAYDMAGFLWPDQEQDETRSGKGWDIEVADVNE